MISTIIAGAATADITPKDVQFLFGYPHVERYSTGVHDPLLSSALYLDDGHASVLVVTNDIIFVTKASTRRVRQSIARVTGIPPANIMVTATHTHSGPITVDYINNEADSVVPKADPAYTRLMEDGMVSAGVRAFGAATSAQAGLAVADAAGIGTNRRDPAGPADLQVPVLMLRTADGRRNIACMLVCCMHPTVLHEDSKLVSGDFPALARQYLQKNVLEPDCPVLHHSGASGNQSPRHITRGNTFEEATRLGHVLGRAVADVIPEIRYTSQLSIENRQSCLDLPPRQFPTVAEAEAKLSRVVERFKHLQRSGASRQEVRTAECDWFGAEKNVALACAARDGRLQRTYEECLPAEIQVVRIGPWRYVAWQGEIFVEYALQVKRRVPDTNIISLANGELQGYIVTPEAAAEGGYEASNALFGPESGQMLVDRTLEMLA
ncbi:MAG: neutral/alkaline non-lysosomal ceramidase N-terminal domain-containing protein [Acidobacteriota bacterium]